MAQLQPMTPQALDRLVKKCLAKDPDDRWQSSSDLASEWNWIAEGGSQTAQAKPIPAGRRRWDRAGWLFAVAVFFSELCRQLNELLEKKDRRFTGCG